jgi:hypothetical protein
MHKRNLKHFPEIYPEFVRSLRNHREWVQDSRRDYKGWETYALASRVRGVCVMDYLMDGDIIAFRAGLREQAELMINLFRRFDAGEPIAPSFVSMLAFRRLLDTLASGDLALARTYSMALGGREVIEKANDNRATINFGYTFKAFVEESGDDERREWLEALREENYGPNFAGYIMMFDAILAKDGAKALAAAHEITRGHKKESKGSGDFAMLEDQFLSVWGIGMVNLARYYKLDVTIDVPLIPGDLLI